MNATITAISVGVMISGGLLLAAAMVLAAGAVLWCCGEYTWRKAKAVYRVNRLVWGLRDLEKHGQVLARPDLGPDAMP